MFRQMWAIVAILSLIFPPVIHLLVFWRGGEFFIFIRSKLKARRRLSSHSWTCISSSTHRTFLRHLLVTVHLLTVVK